MSQTWINALLFQIVWFAAVLGAAQDKASWGWAALSLLAVQVLTTPQWRTDLAFAVVCMAIGFMVDSLWSWAGVLVYSSGALAPVWILTLWAATGLSLNHSLRWFRARPLVGGLAAGAVAPLSYVAGASLGAVQIPTPALLAWVALSWVPIFGILFALTNTIAGEEHGTGERRSHK